MLKKVMSQRGPATLLPVVAGLLAGCEPAPPADGPCKELMRTR
jgi:hypothetical protein